MELGFIGRMPPPKADGTPHSFSEIMKFRRDTDAPAVEWFMDREQRLRHMVKSISATDELKAAARAIREQRPELTDAQALKRAMERDPVLAQRAHDEHRPVPLTAGGPNTNALLKAAQQIKAAHPELSEAQSIKRALEANVEISKRAQAEHPAATAAPMLAPPPLLTSDAAAAREEIAKCAHMIRSAAPNISEAQSIKRAMEQNPALAKRCMQRAA